jgi:hypothetical protein
VLTSSCCCEVQTGSRDGCGFLVYILRNGYFEAYVRRSERLFTILKLYSYSQHASNLAASATADTAFIHFPQYLLSSATDTEAGVGAMLRVQVTPRLEM